MSVMHRMYSVAMRCLQGALPLISAFTRRDAKLHRFATGHRQAMDEIEAACRQGLGGNVYWVHAASLGEYNVVRPLIERLKEQTGCTVVLTFFSPTGVEALTAREQLPPFVDAVFYLPLDTRRNVRRFLDALQPVKAIFAVSEYWVNYLLELRRRQIPAYLISGVVSEQSALLKWYGRMFYGEALKAYRSMMVLDEESLQRLQQVGVSSAVVVSDPLFDAAVSVAATPYADEVIAHFCADRPVFVAGSIHDDNDLELVSTLANRYRNVRFLFVPHEITKERIRQIADSLKGASMTYSDYRDGGMQHDIQVLIIDFIGALSRIYRYGTWAYVGGGFTSYLHSVIEATAYGLPVAYGPRIHRKPAARQLMALGIGKSVATADELDDWFIPLKNAPALLADIRQKALDFMQRNSGVAQKVVSIILENK